MEVLDPEKTLKTLLAQQIVSAEQARQGIVACFTLINREFVKRRMGERPVSEIDTATQEVIQQIFTELGITEGSPHVSQLRHAWRILDEQFGFATEPDLYAQHQQIIGNLLQKAQ